MVGMSEFEGFWVELDLMKCWELQGKLEKWRIGKFLGCVSGAGNCKLVKNKG